jgi:hypothetical protein
LRRGVPPATQDLGEFADMVESKCWNENNGDISRLAGEAAIAMGVPRFKVKERVFLTSK